LAEFDPCKDEAEKNQQISLFSEIHLTAHFGGCRGAIASLTGITPYSQRFGGCESHSLENKEESFHMPMTAKKKKKRTVKKAAAKSPARKAKKRKAKKKK
jgi:hypothetical protein